MHASMMGTAPEYLSAIQTSTEIILRFTGVWGQKLYNFTLLNGKEKPIAIHAASEWCEVGKQRKSGRYFAQLFVWSLAANTISIEHLPPFEESNIPSEQQTLLAVAHGCELRVIGEALVPGIETEHSEVSRETPQMAVNNKPGIAETYWDRMWKHLNFLAV